MTAEQPPTHVNGVPVARAVPLRGLQRTVAQRMLAGRQTTASVTALAEVDATELLAARQRLQDAIPDLTLTHLLVKATALALRAHPRLNATLQEDTIYEFAEVNVAVALALPSDDLQVAVIRRADERPLAEIATALKDLQERAAVGRLRLEDVRGGTFTLSNYGLLRSVVWATPIITPGQVGVLGVGRAAPRVVPHPSGDDWLIRPVLPLALTYDHQVVNVVPAGRFLDHLVDLIAEPTWAGA